MHAINRNTSIVNHKSINLSNSDSGCTCVHGLGASLKQASRAAPRQRLAAINITQWFNNFTVHKKMTAVRAARNLTEDLRRRGWGCVASTRATTCDEGSGDRTGGLLQRTACCAFCRTTGGHHDEQRGRGLAAGISGRPWELGGHGSRIGSCTAGKNRGARGILRSVHCRGWSSRPWEGRWQGGRWRTGKGAMAVGGACSKGVEVGHGCWRPSEQSERGNKRSSGIVPWEGAAARHAARAPGWGG
jgi:hypothetical protein